MFVNILDSDTNISLYRNIIISSSKDIMKLSEANLNDLIEDIDLYKCKKSFSKLFEYFAPRLKNYFLKLDSDNYSIEEIIQEVMIAIWLKAGSYNKDKSSVATWVFTIARNKRIDKIRKEKRHFTTDNDKLLQIPVESKQEKEVFINELSGNIEKVINKLPDEQLKLIKLSYFHDKTHMKIAQELKIPLGTVKSRIRLALNKIKNNIEID